MMSEPNKKKKRENDRIPDSFKLFHYIFPFLALLIGLSVTARVRYSPDSVHYLDIARTFANEGRFATYHLNINTMEIPDRQLLWPPLYPCLLGCAHLLGANPFLAVRIITVLSVLLTCIACSAICKCISGRMSALVGFLAVLICINSMIVYSYAWSEPLFIALVTLYILLMVRYLKSGNVLILSIAGILGGFSFLCRYIGIAALPLGIFIAAAHRKQSDGRIILQNVFPHIGLYTAGFIGSAIPWLLRNYALFGRPFGPPRSLSTIGLAKNSALIISSLRSDIPVTLAILATVPVLHLLFKGRSGSNNVFRRLISAPLFLIFCYSGVYLMLLLSLAARFSFDPIGNRLLSPLYIPLTIASVMLIYTFVLDSISHKAMMIIIKAFIIVALFSLCFKHLPLSLKGWKILLAVKQEVRLTDTDRWIKKHTDPKALLIGQQAWYRRFYTGRTVLEGWKRGIPPLSKKKTDIFLQRWGSLFKGIYLIDAGDNYSDEFASSPILYTSDEGLIIRDISHFSEKQ